MSETREPSAVGWDKSPRAVELTAEEWAYVATSLLAVAKQDPDPQFAAITIRLARSIAIQIFGESRALDDQIRRLLPEAVLSKLVPL